MTVIVEDHCTVLARLGCDVAAGRLIPYLGPGLLATGEEGCPVPDSPRALAARLTARVGVPGRIRGNVWSAAQYIETNRHRRTLERLLDEVFAPAVAPGPIHRWLAGLETVPLIVDTWYDGTMAAALDAAGRRDWGQVQGVTRNSQWHDFWFKFFHRDGTEARASDAGDWTTLLYKPHGAAVPAPNYLLSDSDYVEVLTEIDIQTPVPPIVREMRTDRGFLFLGCRFYDQMLRTFARQIAKRSKGPRVAILPPQEGAAPLTRMEEKFLRELDITPVFCPLDEAAAGLRAATA